LIAFIVSVHLHLPYRALRYLRAMRDETPKTKFRHCPSLAW